MCIMERVTWMGMIPSAEAKACMACELTIERGEGRLGMYPSFMDSDGEGVGNVRIGMQEFGGK